MTGSPPPAHERLRVFVRGLAIEAEIGLYPHERGARQPLVIDIVLDLAPAPVGRIGQTVDYDSLAAAARAVAAEGHMDLVEAFAQRLAAACLADPRAERCRVRVEKPRAVPDAAAAGVEVVLSRSR